MLWHSFAYWVVELLRAGTARGPGTVSRCARFDGDEDAGFLFAGENFIPAQSGRDGEREGAAENWHGVGETIG